MKNALKLFLEFWKSYFEGVFWMIVYLPRIMLGVLMLFGPAMPVYFIGYKLAERPDSGGAIIAANIIAIGIIYYLSEHTKWGEWAKKVLPFDNFDSYSD